MCYMLLCTYDRPTRHILLIVVARTGTDRYPFPAYRQAISSIEDVCQQTGCERLDVWEPIEPQSLD